MTSIILIRLVGSMLVICYLVSLKRAGSVSSTTWEELVIRLNPVRSEGVKLAACLDVSVQRPRSLHEFQDLYNSIGGKEGIRRMKKNADTLLRLAAYTEVWSPGVSRDAIREMRESGLKLKSAAWKITLITNCAIAPLRSAILISDLSRAYCDMVNRLLLLYSKAHVSKCSMLSAACSM